jgi:hypothetical protein
MKRATSTHCNVSRRMPRSTKQRPTACQCPYHRLLEGVPAEVFAEVADREAANTLHGRQVMRNLLLQHARATQEGDLRTVASLTQRLLFLSTLLMREASRNILAEAV